MNRERRIIVIQPNRKASKSTASRTKLRVAAYCRVSTEEELKVPLTEVQEDLKKLRDIRYWVRKATPGTEESKEPPKKQPIKEVLQDKTDEKKAQRTTPAQEKHRQQDMEL